MSESTRDLLIRVDERVGTLIEGQEKHDQKIAGLEKAVTELKTSRARFVAIKDFVVVCLSLTGAAAIAFRHKVIGA